ncbi:MAG: tetratricopeptide repeat protein [Candidatus Melainabacteria bacterium]|nr:tetratricopeptide repeat protein [Candidatus Melainabacteria bacterium]
MIINRELEERLFIWVTMVVAAVCAPAQPAVAQDSSRGWENPAHQSTDSSTSNDARKIESTSKPDNGQPVTKRNADSLEGSRSSGWNDTGRAGGNQRTANDLSRGTAEAAATPRLRGDGSSVYTAGDTALAAGQYADAIRILDDAFRTIPPGQIDNGATALFFERKAIANRGMQRLTESERLIKQAIAHATTGGIKAPDVYARLLFSLADIQSQEGLPRESLTTVRQASATLTTSTTGITKKFAPTIVLVEAMNTEGRSLAEVGEIQAAEDKLNEALNICSSLPVEDTTYPPQSSVSKYSEYLKGKIKINQFYLAAIRGGADKAKGTLEEGLGVIQRYAPGMAPDTRYSAVILNAQKSNFTANELTSALVDAERVPGTDNLIKAALLNEQSVSKERSNDLTGAAQAAKAALDIRTKVLPANSIYVAETVLQSASIQATRGRAVDAAAQAQRAANSLERSAGRGSIYFARATVDLASVYISSNRVERVEPLLLESINTLTKIRGGDHPETMHAIDLLCSTYVRNRKFALAERYGEANLIKAEKLFGASSPKLVLTLTNLGTAYAHRQKFGQANSSLQRAQGILSRSGKSGSAQFADLLASTGVNYTLQKKWAQAALSFKQARAIYSTVYGAKSPHALQMTELLRTMESLKNPRNPDDFGIMDNKFTPTSPEYR